MSEVPSDLSYVRIVAALERDGWMVLRRKASHIHLRKWADGHWARIMIPAHKPVKRTTLKKQLNKAGISLERFLELL
jgi:predicted RNA binding protein YcfA (HicA-like mRNA interferase family)